ncbi:MAG: amidohydrolase family protein [Anaerolineales bacterium]|jgi:predicted TIM-barrel fold metal-dependent hydrolase
MIVDVHAHVFPEVRGMTGAGPTRGLGYGLVSIGGENIVLMPPYNEKTVFTPEMLVANMDWAGVDKAVLLQAPFYGECNPYVIEALKRYPQRLVGAAYFDPWAPDDQQAKLEEILASETFRAIKLECSEQAGLCGIYPEADLGAPELEWLWRDLEHQGLVLVLDLGSVGSRSYQTDAVRRIAQGHPDLKIVVAHLGQPKPNIQADAELKKLWVKQISLGQLPNVWFDCSALPAYLPDDDFPFPSAGKNLQEAINRIGPAKVMWGSDIPGLLSRAIYPQLVKMAHLHTAFLSPSEQDMILWKNASQVFKL